jgi:hypothetical protein
LTPEETARDPDEAIVDWPEHERSTPSARVLLGTVLALGAYLAFREILTGTLLVLGVDPEAWRNTPVGTLVVLCAQAAAAVGAAFLSGAGRTSAFAIGTAIGTLSGIGFLVAGLLTDGWAGLPLVFAQPVVLALGAGMSGIIGSRFWPPVPEVKLPAPAENQFDSLLNSSLGAKREPGTAWLRIVLGAVIIVGGAALADPARVEAQKATQGLLRAESRWEARFVACQLAALVIMAGGMVAGALTGAGIRHGIYTGLLGAIGVLVMAGSYGGLATPGGYVGDELNLGDSDPNSVIGIATMAGGVFMGGVLGGWLGGTLFLPLAPRHLRHRLLQPGSD